MEFPGLFTENIHKVLGSETALLLEALNTHSPVSVRLNSNKKIEIDNAERFQKVPWCQDSFYLNQRPVFTLDPLFHAGAYYVQEAGSMFLDYVLKNLKVNPESIILDLCAAPGGKSTILHKYFGQEGFVVSNEIVSKRAYILHENLVKWGCSNGVVTNSEGELLAKSGLKFDLILVDAPCSGEGMFRKDPNAVEEWSLENIQFCALRQREILTSAMKMLKPGGYIIYSTCTYNKTENEENVKWLKYNYQFRSIELDSSLFPNIDAIKSDDIFAYRFWPHKTKSEGFFISVLQSDGELKITEKITLREEIFKDEIILVPSNEKLFQALKKVHLTGFLTHLFRVKGNKRVPHEFSPWSKQNLTGIPEIETGKETALKILNRTFSGILPNEKGWAYLKYRGIRYALINNIGNRVNNYFPVNWRIRMEIDVNDTPWYTL